VLSAGTLALSLTVLTSLETIGESALWLFTLSGLGAGGAITSAIKLRDMDRLYAAEDGARLRDSFEPHDSPDGADGD
jgi:hypothetical protein